MREAGTMPMRQLGLLSAVTIALASMLGTGVFAAWTPASKLAHSLLIVALAVAAGVAALNAISTARLARIFPDSGGAYLYGRECIGPKVGQVAGWSFLLGKTASASAAALVIGAYLTPSSPGLTAFTAIAIIFFTNISGLRYSVAVMGVLVVYVVGVLMALIISGSTAVGSVSVAETEIPKNSLVEVLAAAGILFVAFAGYARVSVLGSEIENPRKNIPAAIGVGLGIVALIYFLIARVLEKFPQTLESNIPLHELASIVGLPVLAVSAGATFAAGAALFALMAGIARMMVTMSDGGHLPRTIGVRSGTKGVPVRAETIAALTVTALSLLGGIGLSLGLSGFFILIYYAVAHLSSMRTSGNFFVRLVAPTVGLVANAAIVTALALVGLGA
jgi:basic amino acid/polyamine antiporter, APA family